MLSDKAAETIRARALEEARGMGCTCEPSCELVEVRPRVWISILEHEDDCKLTMRANARSN